MRRLWTWYILSAAIWSAALTQRAPAQPYGVQVNVDQMGLDILGDAANEPSIAIDPLNPHNMAIGWRQFDTINDSFRQAGVAHSTDGGQTWTASVLDPGVFRSDPVLDFDADGNFYYSSLTLINDDFQVDLFKSGDGGANWSDPPTYAFGGDKQWMTIDRTTGIGRGNIYQHWNVQFTAVEDTSFTRSTDNGTSFEDPLGGPQPFMKWGQLDVGPDGTLYLAGSELNSSAGHRFSKSTNAQDPLQTPTFSMSQSIDLGGNSSFGGVNPSGLLGQMSVASDHSFTDTRGNVYVLGSVDPAGSDPSDVMFIRSTDSGDTWSNPVRVNNDSPGSDANQWFGTMSVAPNGRIDAIWNDTRNSQDDSTSELFYSYSFDAGDTWLGNIALTDPFDHSLGYPMQEKLGDYYDMISDNTGASLAFAATFNGGQDVFYLRIDAEIPCDFDDDRICDVADINDLLSEGPIAAGVAVTMGVNDQFDLTDDGLINLADRDVWLAIAGSQNGLTSPYAVGDADLSGVVDAVDFAAWTAHKFTETLLWDTGNFNGDAFTDGFDLLDWNRNKSPSADAAVPEPTLSVLLMAALGLLVARRRKSEFGFFVAANHRFRPGFSTPHPLHVTATRCRASCSNI